MAINTDIGEIGLQDPGSRPITNKKPVVQSRAGQLAKDLSQFNKTLGSALQLAAGVSEQNDLAERRRVATDKRVKNEMKQELALRGRVEQAEERRRQQIQKQRQEQLEAKNEEQLAQAKLESLKLSLNAETSDEIPARAINAFEGGNEAAASGYMSSYLEVASSAAMVEVQKEVNRLKIEDPDALANFDQRDAVVNLMEQRFNRAGISFDDAVDIASLHDEKEVLKNLDGLQGKFNNLEDDLIDFTSKRKMDLQALNFEQEASSVVTRIVASGSTGEEIGRDLYTFNEGYSHLPQNKRAGKMLDGLDSIVELKKAGQIDMSPDEFLTAIKEMSKPQKNGAENYTLKNKEAMYSAYNRFANAHNADTKGEGLGTLAKERIKAQIKRAKEGAQDAPGARFERLSKAKKAIQETGTQAEIAYFEEQSLDDFFNAQVEAELVNEGMSDVAAILSSESGADAFQKSRYIEDIISKNKYIDKKRIKKHIEEGVTLDPLNQDFESFAIAISTLQGRTSNFTLDPKVYNSTAVFADAFSATPEGPEELSNMMGNFKELYNLNPSVAKDVLAGNPQLRRARMIWNVGEKSKKLDPEMIYSRTYGANIEESEFNEEVERNIAVKSRANTREIMSDDSMRDFEFVSGFLGSGFFNETGVIANTPTNNTVLETEMKELYTAVGANTPRERIIDMALENLRRDGRYIVSQGDDESQIHLIPNGRSTGISGDIMEEATSPENAEGMAKYIVKNTSGLSEVEIDNASNAVERAEDLHVRPSQDGVDLLFYDGDTPLRTSSGELSIPMKQLHSTYQLSRAITEQERSEAATRVVRASSKGYNVLKYDDFQKSIQ